MSNNLTHAYYTDPTNTVQTLLETLLLSALYIHPIHLSYEQRGTYILRKTVGAEQ